MAALFHYVPNTHVRWRHALAGGVFVAIGIEVAKRVLAWYVGTMPTISAVYGAFAAVPILLLWIYVGWLIVLWGAVIAAYAPSLSMRIARMPTAPGHRFALALSVIGALARAKQRQRARPGAARAGRGAGAPTRCRSSPWSMRWRRWTGWRAWTKRAASAWCCWPIRQRRRRARSINALLLESTPATRAFRERTGLGAIDARRSDLIGCCRQPLQCITRFLPARLASYIAVSASCSRRSACVASCGASA